MSFDINKPLVTGKKRQETFYDRRNNFLYYFKKTLPGERKVFRCHNTTQCSAQIVVTKVLRKEEVVTTLLQEGGMSDEEGSVVVSGGHETILQEDNVGVVILPSCRVTENEYINKQAVQQLKFNYEDPFRVGDLYEEMRRSLSDPSRVTKELTL